MKKILTKLFNHERLSRKEAHQVLVNISNDTYNHPQIAAFLTVYLMRSMSVEELQGFRDALLELCLPIDLSEFDTIDMCGTGGDGKNTFNISTTASFVVAGAGYKVAKHGNYGVSSMCGSSNVLEHLGYQFTKDNSVLKKQLDEANICFLHAPLFHPAMKSVAPIRRALGVKTFFNMLGPMVNPSRPNRQVVGVFNLELARLYNYIYQNTDTEYAVLHALDGYDEISLTGQTKILTARQDKLVTPQDINLPKLTEVDLFGGQTIAAAGDILTNILKNKGTAAQKAVVTANAGVAIQCFKPKTSLVDCIAEAKEAIENGKALKVLKQVIS